MNTPFAAGTVFKESETIPDDHALEIVPEVVESGKAHSQDKKPD